MMTQTLQQYKLILQIFSSICTLSILAALIIGPSTAQAAAEGFNPGKIIDDDTFTNSNSMSWEEIQRFLNNKGTYCSNYQAPCLKSYTEGGKTAAQIIYDIGREHGINPQVLLVLLQKEVGLITESRPEPWQYRAAAGYGCPDSTPGVCNSNYYGFTNQLRWAARMYEAIMKASPTWYTPYILGNNNILWHPNSGCGTSQVNIQNRATQALYNYTPYRPNQAALNAGYGQGDGCSSYGNRNFYLFFNDWFGNSYRGPLWRTTTSNDLYYVEGNYKVRVPSMQLVEDYGLSLKDVAFVTQGELDSKLFAQPFSEKLGIVAKTKDDPALYIISQGYRTPIRSMEQFTSFGYTGADIKTLPDGIILRLSQSKRNLSDFIQLPDNSIIKVESASRRAVFEISKLSGTYASPLGNSAISHMSYAAADTTGDYVVIGKDGGVRLYSQNGVFNSVLNMDAYECWNLNSLPVYKLSTYSIVPGEQSTPIKSCYGKKDSESSVFLLNKNTKVTINSMNNISNVDTTQAQSIIDKKSNSATKSVIKGTGDELSVYENNQKRPIPSMKVYSDLGYGADSIGQLNASTYRSLPYGAKKLSVGTPVLESGGGVSVITSDTSRLSIVSPSQYDHFGYDWKRLVRIDVTDASHFQSTGSLNYYIKTNSGVFFVDAGVRYKMPQALDENFSIDRVNLPILPEALINQSTLSWSMTRFIKSKNDPAIYTVLNGQKRPLASWNVFMRESNNRPGDIVILSDSAIKRLPTGQVVR